MAAVLVVGGALGVAGFGLVFTLGRSLRSGVDAAARVRASATASLVRSGLGLSSVPLPGPGDDSAFVQVVDSRGQVVASSANARDAPVLGELRRGATPSAIRTVHVLPSGERGDYRVAFERVGGGSPPQFLVAAGASLEPVIRATTIVRNALLAGSPLLLLVVAGTAWALVGRALAPVETIRSEVADITALALDRRVPVPPATDEIARLARTMNGMLDRLQAATLRQRQFAADASHELRSPLTTIRTVLEVELAHPTPSGWEETADQVLDELTRMQRIVDDLAVLARADEAAAGSSALAPRAPVDLNALVREEVERGGRRSEIALEVAAGQTPAVVVGEADSLRRVVANLLDNAVRHAEQRVVVGIECGDGWLEVTVGDDGPGVPEAQRARVFERFTRLDESRSRHEGGSGLGLAIAQEIVRRHGGRIWIADADVGTRVVVRLPAS